MIFSELLISSGFGIVGLIGLLVSLLMVILNYFVETKIYFDQDFFELERQILNFSYGKQKLYLINISGVFLQKERHVYQLNIRFYNNENSHYKNYLLGGALGEDESAWLAQEIQDWLNNR
jgi:hypothetical protein